MAEPEGARGHMAQVVGYREEFRPHFERLNRAWIEQFFELEGPDLEVFRDPFRHIVEPGGEVFFLLDDAGVQGTCALVPHGPDAFELAKMAVDEESRGRGYGDLLMEAAIAFSRGAGARRLFLVSNTRLEPALRLYRKHGFAEVPIEDQHGYARVDIQLELTLGEQPA
ncbi:MAG TPA: GNAT family N-acetyltransferase [Gemmatimonadales bacterium]|nr:GNAT family N-acetyltransferase [Gemmatimonadales bacterium]